MTEQAQPSVAEAPAPFSLMWIDSNSEHYAGERRLRYEVLRRPLGMPEGSEVNELEGRCEHCVALREGVVVGCVLWLADEGQVSGKLLQMAVAENARGQEIGRSLVQELERKVAAAGYSIVRMHARETALPFYWKLGYAIEGDPFTEVGIPHRLMQRALTGA